MAKPPKRQVQKAKRTHLPSLSPSALEIFKAQLDQMPQVSQAARDVVMQSMIAAANPAAETSEAVIASLGAEDRNAILQAAQGYAQTLGGVAARGRNALMMDMNLDSLIASQGDE